MHTGEKFRLTQHLLKKIKSYELNLSPPLEPKYHFFLRYKSILSVTFFSILILIIICRK